MQQDHRKLDIAKAAAASQQTSPEHKRFKSLLAQIDKARQVLLAWQQQLPLFAEAHAQQVAPLLTRLATSRRELAFELEALRAGPGWTKADRETVSEMICTISGSLLDASNESDLELKNLFDRHGEIPYDDIEQHELASMKRLLEAVGGIDLGDQPVESADELMQRARAQMAAARDSEPPRRPRKPARQTAAQKRAAEDERRISQTVREVYRKLASALHPDRIAGDLAPDQRAARLAKMQRANAAYEAGDLLALLELQLEIEQVDIAHAAHIAAGQVRHFNKVLAEQLGELHAEIDGRQQAFCESYGLLTQHRIDPHRLSLLLKDETREIAAAQLLVDMQRRALKGGATQVKKVLKQWRADQRAAERDDLFF